MWFDISASLCALCKHRKANAWADKHVRLGFISLKRCNLINLLQLPTLLEAARDRLKTLLCVQVHRPFGTVIYGIPSPQLSVEEKQIVSGYRIAHVVGVYPPL